MDVVITDGYKIETWFYPVQDSPLQGAGQKDMLFYSVLDDKEKPTLVICNGDSDNMLYQHIFLAPLYTTNGFNVVTFVWRGFGGSSEFKMNSNVAPQFKKDILIYSWCL